MIKNNTHYNDNNGIQYIFKKMISLDTIKEALSGLSLVIGKFKVREKSGKFKVREKSGNFRFCQVNLLKFFESQGNLRKVRQF